RIKFMPQSDQEYAARRFQSFDTENPATAGPHYRAGYDCELPPNIRSELVTPRRPRILGRLKPATLQSAAKGPLYLALLMAIVVVAGSIATWRRAQTAERGSRPTKQS